MHAVDDRFPVVDLDVRFLDGTFAHTKRLHFRTRERDTGLKLLLDKVIMVCFFIIRDQFYRRFLCIISHSFSAKQTSLYSYRDV